MGETSKVPKNLLDEIEWEVVAMPARPAAARAVRAKTPVRCEGCRTRVDRPKRGERFCVGCKVEAQAVFVGRKRVARLRREHEQAVPGWQGLCLRLCWWRRAERERALQDEMHRVAYETPGSVVWLLAMSAAKNKAVKQARASLGWACVDCGRTRLRRLVWPEWCEGRPETCLPLCTACLDARTARWLSAQMHSGGQQTLRRWKALTERVLAVQVENACDLAEIERQSGTARGK